MKQKRTKKAEEDTFIEEIVSFVQEDFANRQKERLKLERQWELNMNFLNGNQYCYVNSRGEITNEDKEYFWQSKGVFNHIAPIIESRQAKLTKVDPKLYVRPRSDDDEDVTSSNLAEKLIDSAFKRVDMNDAVRRVTSWSEACGTAFYKVIWNNDAGSKVGELNGQDVYEGDVEIVPVPPFEIFPDNLYTEKLENCKSIIHAKVMPVSTIKEKYNVSVAGEEIDVFDLSSTGVLNVNKSKKTSKNSAVVIERYELPTEEFPNGRLITVSGGKLLYYGELPYKSEEDGKRGYPFVKQESLVVSGSFFGLSVIERLIPIQRAYNAVKNRKHEFLNRLSNGVMTVEDGSIDIEDLEGEGLPPGKVLVYRQGSNPPELMSESAIPPDFADEENKLLQEFVTVSGVSDVSSSSTNARLSSGSALELLVSQDNQRLTASAEIIRRSYQMVAKKVLRLYRQFTETVRVVKAEDTFSKTKLYYADKKVVSSDDVCLENENELLYTESQKRDMLFKLYQSGMLANEDGSISSYTKGKVLTLLGYKDLDYKKGMNELQEDKANNENGVIRKRDMSVEEIDDHRIHIDSHTRYVLCEYDELDEQTKQRFFAHIKAHKDKLKETED